MSASARAAQEPVSLPSPVPAPLPFPGHLRPGAARAFRLWLLVLIVLVLVMVTVGGATRLTGSGLSITEWKPVLGAIPPLNAEDWAREFALYRESSQYKNLNSGMTLGEFQFIYWWEWGHRQLGRFIGLVMLGGFLAFFLTGAIRGRLAAATFGLGLLLGLQGAIGWIMVASGLKPGMVAVAPVKLTLHLVFACLFFIGLVAMATKAGAFSSEVGAGSREENAEGEKGAFSSEVGAGSREENAEGEKGAFSSEVGAGSREENAERQKGGFGKGLPASPGLARAARWLVVAILTQIALGGLVAGSHAGFTYNTWPLMDGELVPGAAKLFVVAPFWENFVDNPTMVQFNHRIGAYIVLALTLWHMLAARGTAVFRRAAHLFALVLAQAALGILTLLLVVPLHAGLAHQALALLVLGYAVVHAVKSGVSQA